jgi:L-iditol 2-dehydrogenase
MGLLHLMLACVMGAEPIFVSEPDAGRRDHARRFGAALALDPGGEDVGEAVLEATRGLGADAVVVTAGLPEVLESSLQIVRLQGALALFGGFPPGTRVPLDPNIIHYRELILTGSQNATTGQYRRALGLLPLMPEVAQLTTHRYPIEDAVKAYESRLAGVGLKSMVVADGG